MPDLPGTRWGSASDIVGGKWLLAGGYAGAAPSNTNVAFNFATNTWDTPPPLPIAKARWAGGTVGTRFAAPGGRGAAGGFTGTNETQVYTVPPCGTATVTPTGTPPTNTATRTATCASGYGVATGTATIVPGTTNTGSACDDCVTSITLPFPFSLYGVPYTSAGADSNGRLLFTSSTSTFSNTCLPSPADGPAIFPHWDDLRTDVTTCTGGCGIYTSVSGTAPNRIFNIEWRAGYFSGTGNVDFEVRLYEGGTSHFDVVYGQVDQSGTSATVGVQDATGTAFTQYECNTGGLTPGMRLTFTQGSCGTPGTNTPTPTQGANTNTPTRTITPGGGNTNTPTNTPGASTNTATRTNTPGGPTNTRTAVAATFTPISTNTPCAVPTFSDVAPTDYFYTAVNWLYCEGAITGYSDGTFRPYNNTTRGQLTKIIVIARHWPIDLTGAPHFTDVDSTNVFYPFIETAYNRRIVSGYADGTFRPFANVTRGQLSKIIVQAMGWDLDTTGGPHFTDVPTTNPFYAFIETAYNHNIISGYSDGTFRWANDATRGQISVIVYRAAAP